MEKILKYFPNITPEQKRQLEMLGPLYEDWNAKINTLRTERIPVEDFATFRGF